MDCNTIARGRWRGWGCEPTDTAVSWTTPESLSVPLSGECGDDGFYSGGIADGAPELWKLQTIDIMTDGIYELSLAGDGPANLQYSAELYPCDLLEYPGVIAWGTKAGQGLLRPGRHTLLLNFPAASAARGESEVVLRLVTEVPP